MMRRTRFYMGLQMRNWFIISESVVCDPVEVVYVDCYSFSMKLDNAKIDMPLETKYVPSS